MLLHPRLFALPIASYSGQRRSDNSGARTVKSDASVTFWIDQLKAGKADAAQPLWERYFTQLVRLARGRMPGASRAAADEEDVAISAFHSFCLAAENGRFPKLQDRDDLWKLLVTITERKAFNQVRDERRLKRGGGQVVHEATLRGGDGSFHSPGLTGFAGPDPTPEFAAEIAEQFRRLLERLGDETLRNLAVLKMEGFSNEEIAGRLEMALRSVERKLGLIRKIWEGEE